MSKVTNFWIWHAAIAAVAIPIMLLIKEALPLLHEVLILAAQIYVLWFFIKHHYTEWTK